jgi:hypothetical protein
MNETIEAKGAARPWLWPDHNIGKKESRRLREEHNRAVNSHADLLWACKMSIGIVDQHAITAYSRNVCVKIAAAIQKARGVTE